MRILKWLGKKIERLTETPADRTKRLSNRCSHCMGHFYRHHSEPITSATEKFLKDVVRIRCYCCRDKYQSWSVDRQLPDGSEMFSWVEVDDLKGAGVTVEDFQLAMLTLFELTPLSARYILGSIPVWERKKTA